MGFLEKVRNMFTEEIEDEDDVKVEKIKKDVKTVQIESPASDDSSFAHGFDFSEEEEDLENDKPVFFDEAAFNDLEVEEKFEKKEKFEKNEKFDSHKRVEDLHEEYEPYERHNIAKREEVKEDTSDNVKKAFKPTPIISPVYGVLDKNYHKEDIVSKNDTKIDEDYIVEPSIDSIRNKAYGTLEDELENTLFGKNSALYKGEKKKEEVKEEENLESIEELSTEKISSLTEDISKELDDLLLEKEKVMSREEAKKEKKERSKKKKAEEDDDLLEFIDSTLYKEGEEE